MADKGSGSSGRSVLRKWLGLSPAKLSFFVFLVLAAVYVLKVMHPVNTLHYLFQTQGLSFINQIESKAYDYRFLMTGTRPADPRIVIVTIDEKANKELGRWPWQRRVIGRGIENIMEDGAAVLGFDAVFAEPDPNDQTVKSVFHELVTRLEKTYFRDKILLPSDLDARMNRLLEQLPEETPRSQFEALMADLRRQQGLVEQSRVRLQKEIEEAANFGSDEAFAQIIEKYRDRIVLGYVMFKDKAEIGDLPMEQIVKGFELQYPSRVMNAIERGERTANEPYIAIPSAIGVLPNLEILSRKGAHFGYFNAEQDEDGIIRRHEVFLRHDEDVFTSLAVETTLTYLKRYSPEAAIAFEYDNYGNLISQVGIGPDQDDRYILIPTDDRGRLLINYYGGKGTYPHISFADAVSGNYPPGTFKDKIVLFGATSIGVYDLRTTPFEKALPGVEIHAAVINNLLNQDFKLAPNPVTYVQDLFIMLVIAILMAVIVPRLSAVSGALITVFVMAGVIWLNFYVFQRGVWLNLIFPLFSVVASYSAITIYRYATEEKEKRQIKSAFGYYLHPAMVTKLADDPGALKLGGEKKILTAFFSDIEGFSTFSEKMQPEELVSFLNVFLTEMTNIAYQYDATVDKYIGDAIVSFYGAPIPFEDHAVRACHSAIDMQIKLAELREEWVKQGLPQVRMRIGLNTGPMVIGNMGSQSRFNYTMMGDTVNLAARLESQCKAYGIYLMIGEETYNQAKDAIDCRFLDLLVVKGKTKPVKVYELFGKKGTTTGVLADIMPIWDEAMKRHMGRDFPGAIELFEKILSMNPKDGPAGVFLKRTKEYLVSPPPENWDGAYVAKSK